MNKIKKILQETFVPNAYGWVLLLFSLILLPNIIAVFLLSDLDGSLLMKSAYLVFSLLIVLLPALFLKLRYYFLLEGLFILLAPLEIAHMILYKMPVTEGLASAIYNTNRGEVFELLYSVKEICLFSAVIWIIYFTIIFTKIRNNYLFTRKANLFIGLSFILFNLVLLANMYRIACNSNTADRVAYIKGGFKKKYQKVYPCNILTACYNLRQNLQEKKKMEQQLQNFTFDASEKQAQEREIYVVVIGESARYGNFSVNNYHRQTSPMLEKTPNLLSYSQVYSTANLTEIALPLLLTRATPLDPEAGYKEKAFTDAFAESGFSTAWIANQSSESSLISRIAKDCNFQYFSLTDFDASTNYDQHLVPQLKTVLDQKNKLQLIVIHTLGSHFRYNFRYPDTFRRFTPAMEGTVGYSILSPSNKELLVNSYDNSICYTDYVLATIIQTVEQEQAASVVLYTSDHAENLFDDENSLIFHGGNEYSEYEIHIPLLIWTSERYSQTYPEKQTALENNKDQTLSSDNFFHSILDIADIHYPEEKLTASFASPSFREDSIRYLLMPDKRVIHFLKENRND